MDLQELSNKIRKQPENYKEEYIKLIKAYQSLLNLPPTPMAITVLQTITSVCHLFAVDIAEIVVKHFAAENNSCNKRKILNLLGIIRRKGLLSRYDFIEIVFECDFKIDLAQIACDMFCDENTYGVYTSEDQKEPKHSMIGSIVFGEIERLKTYLYKGDVLQRKKALFFLIYIYERKDVDLNDVLIKTIEDKNIQIILIDYILNLSVLNRENKYPRIKTNNKQKNKCGLTKNKGKHSLANISKTTKVNIRSNPKLVLMNNNFGFEYDYSSAPDELDSDNNMSSSALLNRKILKDMKNPHHVITVLLQQINSRSDQRMVRLKKLHVILYIKKAFGILIKTSNILLNMIDFSKRDIHLVAHILVHSTEQTEIAALINKIRHDFCDKKDDEIKAFGLHVLNKVAMINKDTKNLDILKETALEFKMYKTKSVFYAYCALMRTIKKHDNMSVQVVNKC